jgi:ABC-type multidrug transport system fused ATPase/permease subunit
MRNSSEGNLESNVLCGTSAVEYCVRSSTVHDMVSCIYHHNAWCRQKQYYGANRIGSGDGQSEMEREIQVEIFLAVAYLSIPSLLAIWAIYQMLHLSRESSQQMNLYLIDPPVEDQPDRHQPPPIDLSFLKISFFVKVNTTARVGLFSSFRSARVLDQVTGTFRAQQVSAIMGPSGSGNLLPRIMLS